MCIVCTVSLEDILVHIDIMKFLVLALLAVLVGEIYINVCPVPVVPKGYIRVQICTKMTVLNISCILLATSNQPRMII